MKKTLSYFLLILLLAIFVSACSSDELVTQENDESTYSTYIILRADAKNEQVTLEWTFESSAKTYNIYYIQSDTPPSYDEMLANGTKIVGADVTPDKIISAPYTVTDLTNGRRYWFSITGVNSSGIEGKLATPTYATPTSTVPLPAPENVRANAGNTQVTVTWTPVTGADHYIVYCYWLDASEEENYIIAGTGQISVPGQSSNSQVVGPITWTSGPDKDETTNLTNGITYYFAVTAVDSSDVQSSPSFSDGATPSATTPPLAPTNLIATNTPAELENGQIYLDWSEVTDATSYDVYIGTAKNVSKTNYWYKDVGTSTVTGYITPVLTSGVKYYFVVTAINNRGNTDTSDDLESAESKEVSATPKAP